MKGIRGFIHNRVYKIDAGKGILLRNLFLLLMTPVSLLVVLLIRALRPFLLIRFGELTASRIGHLAASTEVYLSECDRGIHGKRFLDVFYINSFICNRQLMKMWGRAIPISYFAAGLDWINHALPGGSCHKIHWRSDEDRDIFGVLESTRVHIDFTAEEKIAGESSIKKFGINGSRFFCFLSRDYTYLEAVLPKYNCRYHDFRNSKIENFIPAVERLTRRGYFALRMGSIVKEPLKTVNPRVIDYSIKHRTDFLDIYLGSRCDFYLGDPCGFMAIPLIFRRPLAVANLVPLEYVPLWSSKDLFIPKKLWLRKERRLLTFHEILNAGIGRFLKEEQYEASGIEVIENTPEEINDLAIEMDQRLKKEWQGSQEDEELQQRFWELFKLSELNIGFRTRIGARFLRQNKDLLKI